LSRLITRGYHPLEPRQTQTWPLLNGKRWWWQWSFFGFEDEKRIQYFQTKLTRMKTLVAVLVDLHLPFMWCCRLKTHPRAPNSSIWDFPDAKSWLDDPISISRGLWIYSQPHPTHPTSEVLPLRLTYASGLREGGRYHPRSFTSQIYLSVRLSVCWSISISLSIVGELALCKLLRFFQVISVLSSFIYNCSVPNYQISQLQLQYIPPQCGKPNIESSPSHHHKNGWCRCKSSLNGRCLWYWVSHIIPVVHSPSIAAGLPTHC